MTASPLSSSCPVFPTCSSMDLGVTHRQRHNPVDSICRKLQNIQRHNHEVNPSSPFQIPKFTSSSYDSPQSGLRHNLEVILKKREREGMLTPKGSPQVPRSSHCPTSTPVHPTMNPPTPVNATFTITSHPGEWRGTGVGFGGQGRGWQRNCSTPAVQTGDMFFNFSHGPQFTQPEAGTGTRSDSSARHKIPSLSHTHTPAHSLLSYNLNFCSSDSTANLLQCELPYPALVVKRLSMGDGAMFSSENQKEMKAEVSLICEEDLLDTIFHACDTQRRGKVYVSRIVDYLRHTTSRGSEDSGLEDLCNMLDPEHKDVSIDLDTYHAIMKEDDTPEDLTQESVRLRDSLSAKRSVLLNMTSGSLEAFGGEVSRADLETSDLVFCVADLQFNNQKLQEEVRKLKQSVETMEDQNQKLAEENEELKSQARLYNIKVTMEMDDLQKKMIELCDLNVELQVQNHSFDAVMSEKESFILQKCRQIEELKAAVVEYSSVTELLRADKSKLESQMHMMQPDMAAAGLSLSGAECVSPLSSASALDETLDREVFLLLQGPTPDQMSLEFKSLINKLAVQSELDQRRTEWGLSLEQLDQYTDSLEKELIKMASNIRRSRTEILHLSVSGWVLAQYGSLSVAASLPRGPVPHCRPALEDKGGRGAVIRPGCGNVVWASQLCTGPLDYSGTRVQEQENQKQQLREELDQLNTPGDSREASCQTPDEDPQDLDWDEEFVLQDFLKNEGVEMYRDFKSQETGQTDRRTEDRLAERGDQPGEGEEGEVGERWTVVGGEGQEGGLRGISLLSPLSERSEPDQTEGEDLRETTASTDSDQRVNSLSPQGVKLPECFGPEDAHQPAVDTEEHPLPPCHSSLSDAMSPDTVVPLLQDTPQPGSPEHDRTITAGNSPPLRLAEMVSPSCTYPVMDETILLTGSPQQTDCSEGGKEVEDDITSTNMNDAQKLTQDQLAERVLAEDSLLPVLEEEEEEEEGIQDLSPNEKEIEVVTEFQRLSLGFKCDMFTLEKRLRLEERSRDLAEENVRREVSGCQGLLQALAPLCEDDNQSMEIIQRLQKNLDILIQSMTRVSSRSEMLGAIHQESRVGKAVEIMIQHVENLRRMYTKEHAELTELRENMLQNERSFGSHSGGTHSARRVSIAAIPRSGGGGGPMHFDMPNKAQDTTETEAERLTRRSPWYVTGKSTARPPLKRFVSSGAWVETDEPSLMMMMKGPAYDADSPSEERRREEPVQRKSSLTELGNKITALIMPNKTPSLAEQAAAAPCLGYSSRPASAASGSRGLWLWLALVVVLAGLLALLASLVLQPAVDAAPVGTGDSWVTIQQLLWPYTGLRHNGQPPV
ncbi:unnamed protein product [Coregonus sp. 'balchen']|nr:unnamed protein product [Coregonus sp. 'balchen']